jgi:hypothetical protein
MHVAKKNVNGSSETPQRRAATSRKGKVEVTTVEPVDSAADTGAVSAASSHQPSYDDIAREAYQRYLSRGGGDGQDFDDWIEAERALANRNVS